MRYTQNLTACRWDPTGETVYPHFPAEVPGNVQYDYMQFIGLTDFQYGDRVRRMEETENWHWMYETHLTYEEEPGKEIWFTAEGIDYRFDILLDGEMIWTQEGMYTPVQLDLTGRARPGALLQVHIHPHPNRGGEWAEYRAVADQSCKPPVTYGWDWNPRMLISGLWQPAYIETRGTGTIRSCEPFYTLNEARDTAQLHFETDCDAPVTYTLTDADGQVVYRGTEPDCTVEQVHLWWCNGQGEPYCYRWRAESAEDCREGIVGFRTVRLLRNKGAEVEPDGFPKTRYAAPITIELNGRRIFAKGSNWVNPELFFGRITEARYAEQVRDAVEAHMNIFRVWGGAGINKPAFYDECDRSGIMVWQEFMLACNNYRDSAHYLEILEQEGRSIIRQLRAHPSLVLWCGGNELFNAWSGMDDQSHALRLLNKLCYELDYDRPFLATSPLFGISHGGYLFRYDDGRDVMQVFQQSHQTAYTEFGVPSLSPLETLKRIIPPEEQFPIRETEAWTVHHAFNAWGKTRWLCAEVLEHYFGESRSLEEMTERSALLQRVGYQAAFEEARRQWPYCSAAINWCYNEPWMTAANNSLLAYPNIRKAGYYAVRDALRPVLASARIPQFDWEPGSVFTAKLWLLNDSNESVSDTITATAEIDGRIYPLGEWITAEAAPRTNLAGPTVTLTLPETAGLWKLRLTSAHDGRESTYFLLIRSEDM